MKKEEKNQFFSTGHAEFSEQRKSQTGHLLKYQNGVVPDTFVMPVKMLTPQAQRISNIADVVKKIKKCLTP